MGVFHGIWLVWLVGPVGFFCGASVLHAEHEMATALMTMKKRIW